MFKLNQLAVITTVLVSGSVFAGVNNNDIYLGVGVGQSYLGPDYQNGDKGPRDRDLALQAYLGYDLGENFGIEASYADLGNLDVESKKLDYNVTSLQGVVYLPASSDEFSVYAKLGASYLNLGNDDNVAISSQHDWSLSGGLGVRWNMNENWFARAEYNVYNSDVQAAFLNVGYAFGGQEAPVPDFAAPIIIEDPQVISLDESSSIAIFDFDSAEINNSSRLNDVVNLLKASNGQIIVKAHSDSIGSEEYNQKLSEKRAQSAVNYFVSQGISSARFVAQGMGELYPVASNTTKEGRAQNRRLDVEYTILKQQ